MTLPLCLGGEVDIRERERERAGIVITEKIIAVSFSPPCRPTW